MIELAYPSDRPAPPIGEQRRNLTIAFSDLCRSTQIAASMDPETYGELLGQLRHLAEGIVAKHGGEIVRIDGDGMIIIFGYPAPYEDAGRRATEAAIDLHAAVATLDQAFATADIGVRLHTGIHSGLVLVRTGDIVRGRFEMLGDATNVAARLCDAAGNDEILVSAATLAADRHFFETGPERQVLPAGRRAPIQVLPITGRAAIDNRFAARHRRGVTPFVGRERELARLAGALEACAAGGKPQVALIGPPGIGKTRLLNEFADRAAARGVPVHRGYCESYAGARLLQPILQLVRSIIDRQPKAVRQLTLAHQETLDRLLCLDRDGLADGDSKPPQPRLIAPMLLALLGPADAPAVQMIDDWQWSDDASRQVVDGLIADPRGALMLLLGTRAQDAAMRMSGIEAIEIDPLDHQAAERAIKTLVSRPAPFLVDRLAAQAGGNPLFIEELCHAIDDMPAPVAEQSRSVWLDMMIQSRFARLDEAHADLLKAAAVIGHMVPAWLFESITGRGPDDAMVTALMAEDFLYPGEVTGTIRFKHGITRDAIYAIAKLAERRALHARVADALQARAGSHDGDLYLDALAYHHGAAGHFERAIELSVQAGDRALAVSALDRAQAHYRAALDAIDQLGSGPDQVERAREIVRKLGMASVVDPSHEHLPVLAKAADRARAVGNMEALALAEHWLGYLLYGLGQGRQSIAHLESAMAAAMAVGDQRLIVQLRANLGQSYAIACDYPRALALLDEAIAIKRAHRSGSRSSVGLAYSLSCRAFLHADRGDFAIADADFEAAMEALAGADHEMTASALSHRAAACIWQGRLDDGERHARAAMRVAERVRARYLFAMSRALAAQARWLRDRDPADIDIVLEATDWLDASASQQYLSLNHGWLAESLAETGRLAEARHHAARAFQRARAGDRLGEATAARAMARLAAVGNGPRRPDHYLAIAERSATRRQSAHDAARNLLCAAELAARTGDRSGRTRLTDDAHAAFAAAGLFANAHETALLASQPQIIAAPNR